MQTFSPPISSLRHSKYSKRKGREYQSDDDNSLERFKMTKTGTACVDDSMEPAFRTAADGNEESFFDLLEAFAKLDVPGGEAEQLEQCPLCPNSFPVDEFAKHMFECIKQLDHVEQKEQERMDEIMALQLAADVVLDSGPRVHISACCSFVC
jgi:hypothetical protein